MFRAYLPVVATLISSLLHVLRIHAIGIDRLALTPADAGRYQAGQARRSAHVEQADVVDQQPPIDIRLRHLLDAVE